MGAPKFIQFVDSLVKQSTSELERLLAAGPSFQVLAEWDLTVDEWRLALEQALQEVRERD
jgi:hypothetical protein